METTHDYYHTNTVWLTKVQSEEFPNEVGMLRPVSGGKTNVIQLQEPAKKSLKHNKLINTLGL